MCIFIYDVECVYVGQREKTNRVHHDLQVATDIILTIIIVNKQHTILTDQYYWYLPSAHCLWHLPQQQCSCAATNGTYRVPWWGAVLRSICGNALSVLIRRWVVSTHIPDGWPPGIFSNISLPHIQKHLIQPNQHKKPTKNMQKNRRTTPLPMTYVAESSP